MCINQKTFLNTYCCRGREQQADQSSLFFRQHCVLLAAKDPAMARLFTKWQIAHQIFVTGKTATPLGL